MRETRIKQNMRRRSRATSGRRDFDKSCDTTSSNYLQNADDNSSCFADTSAPRRQRRNSYHYTPSTDSSWIDSDAPVEETD
eukprot:GSA25T00013819001.1